MNKTKIYTTSLSALTLAMAIFVPDWKGSVLANANPYKTPKYIVSDTLTTEKTSTQLCGKKVNIGQTTSTITLYNDNSFDILVSTDSTVTLTGSWYRIGNKATLMLDGNLSLANGDTGSVSDLFARIDSNSASVCDVKYAKSTDISLISPTTTTKITIILNEKKGTAKSTITVKGYSLANLTGADQPVKTAYKNKISGKLTTI